MLLAAGCGSRSRDGNSDPCADGSCVCLPGQTLCDGNVVVQCNDDGSGTTPVETCPQDMPCSNGMCKTPCDAALDLPSNVGCDFWAADLDNEAFNLIGAANNAAMQQFAIVAANNQDYPVTVTVTKNSARVGDPIVEEVVATVAVPPRTASRIDLPQREVDGSMGQNAGYIENSGSGTFVSPHGYHVVTTGPVVVYQFNPIIQAFSNDASTLIPIQALGAYYVVLGYPTANPCGFPGQQIPSLPDHTSVTILASQDDTNIIVHPTHPITASAGDSGIAIAKVDKGGTLQLHVDRYTVVNLESDQIDDIATCIGAGQDGDFTGTEVTSDKPVVVFSSAERGIGFGGADNVVYPPDWDMQTDDICCTDHLEEQLFPVTALGKDFAVARSPIRSTDSTGWIEPDIIRVVGTVDGTQITTNLPAPYNSFVLGARQQKTFAATTGFTMTASAAVQVGQIEVSQQFVKHGDVGDPSLLMIPAAEQHRSDYVFLVPGTFQDNYMVLAKPTTANIILDGLPLSDPGCKTGAIGMLDGVDYDQITCRLTEGHHFVSADMPFGLSVYGNYNVGSYAFVGGSDVKIINPTE